MTSDTPQDPDVPVTVRTTFQPTVDLQVSVREADSLRRRGLLVPDGEKPSDTGGDEKSGDGQEPDAGTATAQEPDATSPPARKR